jgi:hypothetical protein
VEAHWLVYAEIFITDGPNGKKIQTQLCPAVRVRQIGQRGSLKTGVAQPKFGFKSSLPTSEITAIESRIASTAVHKEPDR